MLKRWLVLLCLIPIIINATELMPWPDEDFEFQPRLTGLYQTYRSIAKSHGYIHKPSYDRFYTLSVGMSAFDWSGEIETVFADTPRQRGTCDCVRLTGRYRWLNDIVDDPVSLTTGITIIQAFRHSVNDISSFHHGQIAAEAHIAVGKETSHLSSWLSHWWGVFGIGMADQGYPWIRGDAYWEKNWCDQSQLRLFLHSLWGLGDRNLHAHSHFRGYGPIAHRSIDIGARYTYNFDLGILSFEYAHRVYAVNFPAHANLFLLSYLYPFGL